MESRGRGLLEHPGGLLGNAVEGSLEPLGPAPVGLVGLSGGGLGSQKGPKRLQEDLRRLPGGQKCLIFTWVLYRLPFLSLSSRENAS